MLLAGLGLLLVGFGFKVSAVPFHMWTPDVYQGAPTPATGFMTAIAKAGGFAALLRVFFSTFATLRTDWQPLLWALAILTLVLGAVLGLVQRDVKRMLAYSSINHAGFILVGLAAATTSGISGSVYYVFVYAFMVLGSFAVITVVGGTGDRNHDLDAYRGLGRRQPALALAFAVLLLGQTGVPFTTGFLAKLYVVSAAVKAHSYALAVIAMLSAAVAAAFYLRLVFYMYGVRLPVGDAQRHGLALAPPHRRGVRRRRAARGRPAGRRARRGDPRTGARPGADGDRPFCHRRRDGRVRDLARPPRRVREGGRLPLLTRRPCQCPRVAGPCGAGPDQAEGWPAGWGGLVLRRSAAPVWSTPSSLSAGWKNLPIRGSSQNDSARAMASAVGKVFSAASHTT